MREVARFFLRRRGVMTDFVAFYRERTQRDAPARELAAAVAGVGETGGPSDVEVIVPCLAHERAAVRRACVWTVGALDLTSHLERVAAMLWDEAPSVSHAARHVVRPSAPGIGAAPLLRILRRAPHAHSRIDALLVAAKLGKWESLPVLIEAAAAHDERVRLLARNQLAAWVANQNRRFVQPTPQQVDAARAALDAFHLVLDRAITDEIAATLRFWVA